MGASITLEDQITQLRAGTISSYELISRTLDEIEASNPKLNAFCLIRKSEALLEAREADKKLSSKAPGKLLGVPIALKDDLDLKGSMTRYGTNCKPAPAKEDCEVVRRLKLEGAIIVGKTQSSELGLWPFSGNEKVGYVQNPWKEGLTPGGSSGGSAAAVSSGLVTAAIGSDGAGSLRIPAAWTNLVSIKPQKGRVATYPWREINNGLHAIGAMARNVKDATILLDAIAGAHIKDKYQAPTIDILSATSEKISQLKVGLALTPPFTGFPIKVDKEVQESIINLSKRIEMLGHDICTAKIPHSKLLYLNFLPRSISPTTEWFNLYPDPENMDKRSKQLSVIAKSFRGIPLTIAKKAEPRLQKMVEKTFNNFDVLITPVNATQPPPVNVIEGKSLIESGNISIAHCPFTWTWNVLGWPALSIPCGFDQDGLPIGAQILGPPNSEPLLIKLATQIESIEKWFEATPKKWW